MNRPITLHALLRSPWLIPVAIAFGLALTGPARGAEPVAPAAPATPEAKRFETAGPDKSKKDRDAGKACRDVVTKDAALEESLRALEFETEGGRKPLREVRFVGLKAIDEKLLWDVIGGKPPQGHVPADSGWAALVVRRLAKLGLFSRLTPVIDARAAGGPVLTVHLTEHPSVRKVVIEGLSELKPEGLLEVLFETPSREDVKKHQGNKVADWIKNQVDEAEAKAKAEKEGDAAATTKSDDNHGGDNHDGDDDDDDDDGDHKKKRDGVCPDPLPPREWLARTEGDVVFPGVAWKGLQPGVQRLHKKLVNKGYLLATLTADLGADGTLTVRVTEGKLARFDVAGVAPGIADRVRAATELAPGQPFVKSDLDDAQKRVRKAFPFLRTDSRERTEPRKRTIVETASGSDGFHYSTADEPQTTGGTWFTVTPDGALVLHFKAQSFEQEVDGKEFIRHTPVTSFAPGLEGWARFWDPGDRAHLRLYAAGNVNTTAARHGVLSPSQPGEVVEAGDRSWRFDWTGGGSVLVPALRLAELGAVGYSRVDTADRWRINRVDSYLYSLFFNRADSDYFHRTGFTAFATVHLFERLTAGVEYRRDRYHALASLRDMFTVFNRKETPQPTALIDEGVMGSLLFRLEWSSLRAPAHVVGDLRRDPERSIVERSSGKSAWADVRTMNTLELARPGLGGGATAFSFVRLVSDSAVFISTGSEEGFKVRFRAAGALDGTLPLQKQESLGGWSAVRGLGFKEQRGGDFSLLGTAEYRHQEISLFVDVGSLRINDEFGAAKAGAGLALNFSDKVHLDFAWRMDNQARLRPEIRLLFHRTF